MPSLMKIFQSTHGWSFPKANEIQLCIFSIMTKLPAKHKHGKCRRRRVENNADLCLPIACVYFCHNFKKVFEHPKCTEYIIIA